MPPRELLSESERAALQAAVVAVERASGAELVPVLVARSDDYVVAVWRAAAAGALAGVALHGAAPDLVAWSAWSAWVPLGWSVAGALLGALVVRLPAVGRRVAGAGELERRVAAGAELAFLEHEVFRTSQRTGLLLYVSLFERRVRILADEGVYRAVPRTVWEQVAGEAAAAMRVGAPAAALLAAVRRAGELVAEHGPRRRADDRNELPDRPSTPTADR